MAFQRDLPKNIEQILAPRSAPTRGAHEKAPTRKVRGLSRLQCPTVKDGARRTLPSVNYFAGSVGGVVPAAAAAAASAAALSASPLAAAALPAAASADLAAASAEAAAAGAVSGTTTTVGASTGAGTTTTAGSSFLPQAAREAIAISEARTRVLFISNFLGGRIKNRCHNAQPLAARLRSGRVITNA